MSWSASVTIPKGTVPVEALEATIMDAEVLGNTDCPTERDAAAASAKRAVYEILRSTALGGGDHSYSVSMSGHANPGNELEREGVSRDFINIQIYQNG